MPSLRTAIVVGSGPNGLAAAITLARAGIDVTVLEANDSIGGGTRSAPLTLPGFTHDVCSAIHPLGVASPFFRALPLADHGLEWIHPPVPLAHPLDDGRATLLHRSIDETAAALGHDGDRYRRLFAPLVAAGDDLLDGLLAPLIPPRHIGALIPFGLHAIRSVRGLARRFHDDPARALLAGIGAHSFLPLDAPASGSFALMLGLLGHAWGWPLPRGGSQSIANALASYFTSLGGRIVTSHEATSPADVDGADIVIFDITPRQLLAIGGNRIPDRYRRRLARYRYGPAAFKVDWALDAPIPWRSDTCRLAATVHLGGTLDDIRTGEAAVASGRSPDRPFVLMVQPSLFDETRAPAGQHVAWAYCHVPNGSTEDMTARIEAQIERFAPGFTGTIVARHVMPPSWIEAHNANAVGGDIVGGANDLLQLIARPVLSFDPYAIPVRGWYLCSSSTPPGGGVHGMGGYHAARHALRDARM